MFSITPLLFDALSPRNPLEFRHKPYIAGNYSHWATSSSLTIFNLHSNFRSELQKMHVFWNGVHYDPSRSSKVVDFGTNRKRVYDFLFDNSNLGPILPRFRDITAFVRRKPLFTHPPLFRRKFLGVPLGLDPWPLGCKERTPQANWPWNYFRRIPTYVITIHQRHRQTDRQTTCNRKTALCSLH